MLPLLASALAFTSIILIFVGIALSLRPSVEKERLSQFARRARTLEELELQAPFSERVLRPILGQLAGLVSRFAPQAYIETISRRLVLAGNPNNMQVNDFLGLQGLVALILGGGTMAVLYITKASTFNAIFLGLLLAALGFLLPNMWLGGQISRRKEAIIRALPDALDLLTISVEAGLGLDSAIAKVVEKWDNPLSMEFSRVLAEIRVGKPRREALRDMVARTEVPDVTSFVAAIIQAEQLGVSISRVLQIQSEQMRIRRRQRAEEQAHQAPVKMTFPTVFLVFPALLIVILGPSIPRIIEVFTAVR